MKGDFIPLASPDLKQKDIDAVVKVLKTGNLVQGKEVLNLEKKIGDYLSVPNCVIMTNGTSTLELILKALNIGQGDEVIVPAFSYMATANVVELSGAKTIFVDIDIDSFNINKNLIVEKINSKTKAIIVVHEFGLTADIFDIKQICDHNNIYLIEDAACALGAMDKGYFAGTVGIAGSFSFHPRKAITSGEGGAIVTYDNNLATILRNLRNHGIDSTNSEKMDFVIPGHNYRMTDFQAALLSSQMDRIEKILIKKNEIALKYLRLIKNEKITLPRVAFQKKHSWQTFHIVLHDSLDQNNVINFLRENGIGCNYGAQCMPSQTFFSEKYKSNVEREFPNALKAYKYGIALPLYEKLTKADTDKIIEIVNKI